MLKCLDNKGKEQMIKQPEGLVTGLPNCGVVAVASALDLPYNVVLDYFQKSRTKRWKGRLRWNELKKAVQHFKADFEDVQANGTLAKWVDQQTAKDVTYIVRTGGHFLAVRNNIVVDQDEREFAGRHIRRRRRVNLAMKINV